MLLGTHLPALPGLCSNSRMPWGSWWSGPRSVVAPQHHVQGAVLALVWFIVPSFPGRRVFLLRGGDAHIASRYSPLAAPRLVSHLRGFPEERREVTARPGPLLSAQRKNPELRAATPFSRREVQATRVPRQPTDTERWPLHAVDCWQPSKSRLLKELLMICGLNDVARNPFTDGRRGGGTREAQPVEC